MDTDQSIEIISEYKSTNLTSGDLELSWEDLHEIFEPKDSTSKIEICDTYHNTEYYGSVDFNEWISMMEKYRRKLKGNYGETISGDDFLVRLIHRMKKGVFSDLKISFTSKLNSGKDPLTIESFKYQLRSYMMGKKIVTNILRLPSRPGSKANVGILASMDTLEILVEKDLMR